MSTRDLPKAMVKNVVLNKIFHMKAHWMCNTILYRSGISLKLDQYNFEKTLFTAASMKDFVGAPTQAVGYGPDGRIFDGVTLNVNRDRELVIEIPETMGQAYTSDDNQTVVALYYFTTGKRSDDRRGKVVHNLVFVPQPYYRICRGCGFSEEGC